MLRERINRVIWKDFDKELYDREYRVNFGIKFFKLLRWVFFEDSYLEENIGNSEENIGNSATTKGKKAIGFISKKFEK